MRCLAKLQTRSERIGFLLYAIADEPIWVDSNGSSISYREYSKLRSIIVSDKPDPYLQVGQEPDVRRNLMSSRAKGSKSGKNISVNFSGICLRSHWIGIIETRELGDEGVEYFYFVMVAIKESQEAGLGSRGAFDTSESEVLSCTLDIP
jgi:hypothetical protein